MRKCATTFLQHCSYLSETMWLTWRDSRIHLKRKAVHIVCIFSCNRKLKPFTFIALHRVKRLFRVSMTAQRYKVKLTSELPVAAFRWGCSEHTARSYAELQLLLPCFEFRVITLLSDFFLSNQINQDIHRKYTLSSDAELILIRSLTLGKVTSKSLQSVLLIQLWPNEARSISHSSAVSL